jgi:CysZ protein
MNFVALLVFLLPGVNLAVFFVANAYLLGREYFELAALRYRPLAEVQDMRRRHKLYIFACGFLIAGFVVVPILNLLTPLFGTAFMVRIHQKLSRDDGLAIPYAR